MSQFFKGWLVIPHEKRLANLTSYLIFCFVLELTSLELSIKSMPRVCKEVLTIFLLTRLSGKFAFELMDQLKVHIRVWGHSFEEDDKSGLFQIYTYVP